MLYVSRARVVQCTVCLDGGVSRSLLFLSRSVLACLLVCVSVCRDVMMHLRQLLLCCVHASLRALLLAAVHAKFAHM